MCVCVYFLCSVLAIRKDLKVLVHQLLKNKTKKKSDSCFLVE